MEALGADRHPGFGLRPLGEHEAVVTFERLTAVTGGRGQASVEHRGFSGRGEDLSELNPAQALLLVGEKDRHRVSVSVL